MAEDKMFDLITKIYSELQDTKKEILEGFTDIKSEVSVNRTAIIKLESKLENDTTDKIRALYDNRVGVNDKLDNMDEKIDILQKSVNDLGIKTLVTDNKLIDLSRKVR